MIITNIIIKLSKKILYTTKVSNILYSTHISDIHCNFKKSKVNLLDGEYYYLGITTIKQIVKKIVHVQQLKI